MRYLRNICVLFVFFSHLVNAEQILDQNAVTSAEDAFGMTVGNESLGVYNSGNVRGFSPNAAGNYRIEGLYFDRQANLNNRIQSGSAIRVGAAAQGYAFPSPTGIIDVHLRESGNDFVTSPKITYGADDTYGIELDAKVPIIEDKFSIALGTSAFKNHFTNGGHSTSASFGIVPRWRPDPRVEVLFFAGSSYSLDETNPATYLTESDFKPENIIRGRFPGPSWATTDSTGTNLGTIVKGIFGDWTVRIGRFYSIYDRETSYANLFNLSENGDASRTIVAYPTSKSTSSSGEIRISKLIDDGQIKHLITTSLRDRTAKSNYGGGSSFDFEVAELNSSFEPIRPNFQMGEKTNDTVKQITGAISYGLMWEQVGELTFGMLRTSYDKTVKKPDTTSNTQNDNAWLPSLSFSKPLSKNISFYASYVKGIEDAGVAPSYAENGNQVLPAIRTKQWDAGLQWKLSDQTKLIVGYYDIVKPYIAMSKSNYYKSLGEEIHQGIELSLTTSPLEELTLVAGAILSKPRVNNVTETNEVIGVRPVAQSDYIAQLSFDYGIPWIENFSFDGGINYQSSQAATVENNVTIPSYTTIDLGARYKFNIGKNPSLLRIQATNITNQYSLYILGSGAYETIDKRGISASISTRF
ncbi:TonB-dependent receptor domain-containing protein [Bacillus licheniformis]